MYPIEKYNIVTYDKKNEDGTTTKTTVAISTYGGKVVKGIARCSSEDTFDAEKGIKLAAARCDYKVCDKRFKRASDKKKEAEIMLQELTAYYLKMCKYYDDAFDEAVAAKDRLNIIEASLA